ncbi:hypothetical protein D915_002173 [Fasciola hepatica]|uniref:Uncharacterized protein n=1 Tax=Fasciola hepatica TaxID=6192 RepID=A0A4E0RGW3_FASHE|nr:hypothetical protein D915_002173 [Fasciola hepatica]
MLLMPLLRDKMLPTLGVFASKGDISLYSRIVKTGDWLDDRVSEPRDYEICTDPIRSLHRSTYLRFGTDQMFRNKTTYMDMCCDTLKRNEMERPKSFMSYDLAMDSKRLRNIPPTLKELAVAKKVPTISTYTDEYCTRVPDKAKLSDKTFDPTQGRKLMISQFTDVGSAKRLGQNTWADESGVYANTHIKRQIDACANHMNEILINEKDRCAFYNDDSRK